MFRKIAAAFGAAVVLVFAGAGSTAHASDEQFVNPIIDGADVFTTADEDALYVAFEEDFQEYGLSFVVETVESLNGANLEEYSLARANELGVGPSFTDTGVYILFVNGDRVVRFELGSGVSAAVTDEAMQYIIDNTVLPQFREGEFVRGIEFGADGVGNEFLEPGSIAAAQAAEEAAAAEASAARVSVVLEVLKWVGAAVVAVMAFLIGRSIVKTRREEQRKREAEVRRVEAERLEDERIAREEAERDALQAAEVALSNQRHDVVTAAETALLNTSDYENLTPVERANIINPFFDAYQEEYADEAFSRDDFRDEVLSLVLRPILWDVKDEFAGFGSLERALSYGSYSRSRDEDYFRYVLNSSDMTVSDMRDALVHAVEQEYARLQAAVEAARVRREREAEAARVRRQKEKAEEDEAKRFWRDLPYGAQDEVRRARTKREKQAVLARYNTTGMDMSFVWTVLIAAHAYDLGRVHSESSYADSSYSGSSSSSYGSSSRSSSYDSFSSGSSFSFGGGSFDGGGASGSW